MPCESQSIWLKSMLHSGEQWYYKDVSVALSGGNYWAALRSDVRTRESAAFAFAMLARGSASVFWYCIDQFRGYPWILFSLLEDPTLADQLAKLPPDYCEFDVFT